MQIFRNTKQLPLTFFAESNAKPQVAELKISWDACQDTFDLPELTKSIGAGSINPQKGRDRVAEGTELVASPHELPAGLTNGAINKT